jgi:hypothetical protein
MIKEDLLTFENSDTILKLKPLPFSVSFTWEDKNIKVQLDNGQDVLKLAKLFSDYLTNNNIPNTIF